MAFIDEKLNLRIELDTKNCELSPATLAKYEAGLEPLREPVKKFPVSDLNITVAYQPRTETYRVKTTLALPGRTLAAGDIDRYPYTAFERCIRKLIRRLLAYQDEMSATDELSKHQKGTQQLVVPEQEPDIPAIEAAVRNGDYSAFRDAMYVYEEPVRKRIGRWVERYPEVERRLNIDLTLADMVEEVFLNAFEYWDERPSNVPLGEWLEQLIDPSLKLLSEHPSEELENIQFAHTLREM